MPNPAGSAPNTIWMSVFRSETNAAVEITEAVDPEEMRSVMTAACWVPRKAAPASGREPRAAAAANFLARKDNPSRDQQRRTKATGDDPAEALAFALGFEGRNRVDDVGEFTSAIVAKRLARREQAIVLVPFAHCV